MNSTHLRVVRKARVIRSSAFGGALMLLIGGGLIAVASRSVQAASQGVPDQLQQMFDQGQYKPLLPQLNAAISQTSPSDTGQRYSLLMLKGEALLRVKADSSAEDAFHAASLVAPDANSIAIANATVTLIKHSGSSTYQPKIKDGGSTANPAPIDILDKNSRKDAFSALFSDTLATLKPQVDNIDNMTSLPPLVSLAAPVKGLGDIEIASIGSNPQSKEMLQKLATRAATLLTNALKPLDGQVTAVGADAAKRQKNAGKKAQKDDPSSLTPDDITQLDGIVSEARQIGTAATNMQNIFGVPADFKAIPPAAEKVINAANKILTQYKHQAA
jgi:hypothetical protein